MLITVYQTNTGHRAVGLYNESNAQNKFTFKCWSCHAFNIEHQLSSFWALCFAIFADEVVLLIFVLQTFSWNNSPVYFVCSPLSSLERFRNICVTLCCQNNTAWHRTLRYSLVLLTQTSNFPYSLQKSQICLLCETIFVEEFCTFTKRGAESTLFLFSATHSKFCCSEKIK